MSLQVLGGDKISLDNFTLDVIFTLPIEAKKVVIFAHGLTVDKDDEGVFVRAAKELNKLGIATLLFDFRGHGKSSGDSVNDFTISGQLIDLETVSQFVQSKKFSSISIGGASFGGGAVSLFLEHHSSIFNKVVLVNPVLDYDACFLNPVTDRGKKYFSNYAQQLDGLGWVVAGSRRFRLGKKLFEEMKEYFPCSSLSRFSTRPLLVIHGDQDSYVDFRVTKNCFDQLKNPQKRFETVVGSDHGFHEEPFETEIAEMIVEFLK